MVNIHIPTIKKFFFLIFLFLNPRGDWLAKTNFGTNMLAMVQLGLVAELFRWHAFKILEGEAAVMWRTKGVMSLGRYGGRA
jgi:signal transduction histidine kinase